MNRQEDLGELEEEKNMIKLYMYLNLKIALHNKNYNLNIIWATSHGYFKAINKRIRKEKIIFKKNLNYKILTCVS